MLKYLLDSLEGVPADLHQFYKETDGKFVLQVEGVKTQKDIDGVQASLTKERNDHKKTKDKLEEYADIRALGLSPTDILGKLDRFDELEAAAGDKIDEGKLNQMVEARIKAKLAPIERERDGFKAKLDEATGTIQEFTVKEKTRTIHDKVREAALKGKVTETALDDVLMVAERVFELDESGNVIAKDGVGLTPGIDPTVWLTEMQQKRPHWWPTSQGGGAGGGKNGGGSFTNNPFSAQHWNMTEQGRLVQTNHAQAEQMAKAAGTTIGGPRPAAK